MKRSTSNRFIATNVETSWGPSLSVKRRVRFEGIEGGAEVGRQRRAGVGVVQPVRVADDRIGRHELSLDPVQPGEQQRGDHQMRAGGTVCGADLDPGTRAALVRDAAEGGAVVVAPVRVRRCEAVGQDPLVGVDRRPEQRLQPGRVLDHAGDELRRQRAEPVRPALVGEGVVAVLTVQREVNVEARAALVGERPPHEGREQPFPHGDLLHGGLQHEGSVGGVEGAGVLDVDLVLRVHELVVGGERLQAELVAPEQHPEDDLARVGDGTDGVDARELVDVAAQPVRRVGVALGQEELELRARRSGSRPRAAYASITRCSSARGQEG